MSKVRIPPVLRPQAGGQREVTVQGSTVREGLGDLVRQFPALDSQLFQDGAVQRYVNVYLNDQDISYLLGLDTPLGEGDTVIILPAMAGGN